MLNMLIIDDEISCIKKLISYIFKNEENVRLLDIASNGIEALEILDKNKADIILLDLKMSKMNGINLIEKLERQKLKIYEKSIIVITAEDVMLQKIIKSPLIYSYQLKPIEQDNLLKDINDIVREKSLIEKNEKLDKKIVSELKYLNYNLTHLGTQYLKECIKIDFLKYEGEAENLSKQIYPIIAKKYKKKVFSIKNNIIKATSYMYNECKIEILMKYFGYDIDYKPTPKTVIKAIVRKL